LDLSIACASAPDLRSLHSWLVKEPELKGRVRLAPGVPAPDRLGPGMDTLLIALGPGGVATAVASVAIAWIRRQTGSQTVRITRPDGSAVEVTAEHVRGLDQAGVHELIGRLAQGLQAAAPGGPEPGGED
jgi:hypothetical protein